MNEDKGGQLTSDLPFERDKIQRDEFFIVEPADNAHYSFFRFCVIYPVCSLSLP